MDKPSQSPLLEVRELKKTYVRGGWSTGAKIRVRALDSVSLTLKAGASIAFVGESGCGKSTLAMCVCRLIEPDSGNVFIDGVDLLSLSGSRLRRLRSAVQLIFQDAATAFNPSFTAAEVVLEPMVIEGLESRGRRAERTVQLLKSVGLSADSATRLPMQFSGGQRQRLAIARALAANARVLILDESLSALDMSIQAEIAGLLLKLQAERGLALIYISHDIELAGHLADEIAVMSGGRIVEQGTSVQLLQRPQHPETISLVEAMLPFAGPRLV
jgi:peptide/nickel transport system ATP-binding protein